MQKQIKGQNGFARIKEYENKSENILNRESINPIEMDLYFMGEDVK